MKRDIRPNSSKVDYEPTRSLISEIFQRPHNARVWERFEPKGNPRPLGPKP